MTLNFRISYRTQWGENIGVNLLDTGETIMLSSADGELWEGSCELTTVVSGSHLRYSYGVYRETKVEDTVSLICTRCERATLPHSVTLPDNTAGCNKKNKAAKDATTLNIRDHWRTLPLNAYLFTTAFNGQSHSTPATKTEKTSPLDNSIVLRVIAPGISQKGETLGIVGEGESLGEWQHPLALQETDPNHWEIALSPHLVTPGQQYKFVAFNTANGNITEWEEGENRQIRVPQIIKHTHSFFPEEEVYLPSVRRKVAGVAVPVFALRSEGSQGVGDFGDLRLLIDWAVRTGQRAVQILPINDTTMFGTWQDSYPYNAISIYAFHPMFIDLRSVGPLSDKAKEQRFQKTFRQLNALTQIDYEAVNKAKRDYLLLLYREKGLEVLASEDYKNFYDHNEEWLRPYAAFCVLRDKYNTPAFSEWPEHNVYDASAIEALCQPDSPYYQSISFYCYLQYLLHVQLQAASEHARKQGVIFKGDIPIGVSRTSVETWVEPYYFNMNGQAGAPPDPFSTTGQNWGFPTYNWDVMRQDGYRWWKRRFSKMAEYFTCYRIDHILGFFRIWEILGHSVQGMLGQFSPALPMSPEEIESFGLRFQRDFMTRPFICDEILYRVFGDQADFVRNTFLTHSHYDIWNLRPEYSTQRDILAWYNKEGGRHNDAERVRDGMYTLINNVLFIPDNKESGKYNPRISGHESMIFERLNYAEREAYMRLYNHYFFERHNAFWYEKAMEKLPQLLDAAPMLACGEDLGMVPDCVPWVMEELQIVSLEIERMPKNPEHEFGKVWEYPLRSVCTIGTHDMSTFRGWWKEDASLTHRYYHHQMGLGGNVPAEATGWICKEVVKRHLESPSLLAILALQDWLAIDEQLRLPDADAERINIPANPRHYWRYRMHISLESLLRQDAFNDTLRTLNQNANRA